MTLAEVGKWYRLAPAVCAVWTALATAWGSFVALWALVPFALLGALLPRHPFDLIYQYGIRLITGGRSLPKHGIPRRFACSVATVWLVVTGWAFWAGQQALGYVLGFTMAVLALFPALTDFCVPSYIFNTLFIRGRSKRSGEAAAVRETAR